MEKVSIVIPVYNEKENIHKVLKMVEDSNFAGLEKEIILIDDFSNDGTREILKNLEEKYKVFYHPQNLGKGAALRTGFQNATGDITVIQDADLEYNCADYDNLIKVIQSGETKVCYGSRFASKQADKRFLLLSFLANKTLTFITNILYQAKLTDMETCYKAFKSDFIKEIKLKSNRFDFEPEITAKVLKKGVKIKEIPISYNGREYAQGKKITWKDGICAIVALIKYRFVD